MGADPDPGPPTLFLVVDGVPFDIAEAAHREGLLPDFRPPKPLISVFPSLTNVAVPALLRGAIDVIPPGYEARYYHPPSGELRGGFGEPASEPGLAPYRTRPEGFTGHFAVYVLRRTLAWSAVRWVGHRFLKEGGPWLGYIAATDGIGHFSGREGMREAFFDICGQVVEARDEYRRRRGVLPRVVLCSDHGFAFGPHRHLDRAEVEERVRLAGFHLGDTRGAGVVLAPMGDVGAGAAWCAPEAAPELAEAIAELPGVEVAAAWRPDGAQVFAVHGDGMEAAALRRRSGETGRRFRYQPLTGDPLRLTERLEAAGGPEDFADRAGFLATWDHRWPDPVARIVDGLTSLVEYPAQVLFSLEPGWTFGPRTTGLAAGLLGGQVGTHGGLGVVQSTGFAALSGEGEDIDAVLRPPALRAGDVFSPFAAQVRVGAAR